MGDKNKIILNLGCGYDKLPTCINIDIRKKVNPDLLCDIKKLPYSVNTISRIYALDVLEHIPRNLVKSTLQHWYRILKEEGFLILRLPNLYRIAEKYFKRIINCNEFAKLIYGGQEDNEAPNFHNSGFDVQSLTELLEEIGFKNAHDSIITIPCNDNNMLLKFVK